MLKRILKKGKYHYTLSGKEVIALSKKIVKKISPFCKRIKVVGSIRRKSPNPVDIDIVVIPKDKEKIEGVLSTMGKKILSGPQKISYRVKEVKVEIYFSKPEEWGAQLLAYTGPQGESIGLRVIAKKMGFLLNQHGLFKNGKRIAGKTEREIFRALNHEWKPPEKR